MTKYSFQLHIETLNFYRRSSSALRKAGFSHLILFICCEGEEIYHDVNVLSNGLFLNLSEMSMLSSLVQSTAYFKIEPDFRQHS